MASNRRQLGQLINYILGNGAPAPYMGLNIRGNIQDGLNDFAQRYLPQAPGMQRELFQEWYPEDSLAKYELMKKYYNY